MDKSTTLSKLSMETVYLAGVADLLDALLDKYDDTPPSQDALEAIGKMLHETTDSIRELCDDLDEMEMKEKA